MKSPKPPDPYQTAAAQFGSENSAAQSSSIINNPNIFTPYGSQTYKIAGWEQVMGPDGKMISVPRYNQTQTLNPGQQNLYNLETATQTNLGETAVQQSDKLKNYLNQSIDPSKWQAWNAGPTGTNLATTFGDAGAIQKNVGAQNFRQDQTATDRPAIEAAMMQLYNKNAGVKNEAEAAQLAARGASAGTPIANQAALRQGDEYSDAVLKSYLGSGAESRAAEGAYNAASTAKLNQDISRGQFSNDAQNQLYQQLLGRAGFSNEALTSMFNASGSAADRQNSLRNLQAAQDFATRNQPINEIMALLGGSGVTMPTFAGYQGQGIQAPNIAGLINSNYQQTSANANNMNAGLFGTAATVLGGLAGGPVGAAAAGGLSSLFKPR